MKTLLVPLALFYGCSAQSAYACSIEPPPVMTAEEKAAEIEKNRRNFVQTARSSRAIIEIKALNSSGEYKSGNIVKVLRVYRGNVRRGAILQLDTIPSSACGAGRMKRRERGIIILSASEPRLFNGFLWSGDIEILQKEGILPAKLPK